MSDVKKSGDTWDIHEDKDGDTEYMAHRGSEDVGVPNYPRGKIIGDGTGLMTKDYQEKHFRAMRPKAIIERYREILDNQLGKGQYEIFEDENNEFQIKNVMDENKKTVALAILDGMNQTLEEAYDYSREKKDPEDETSEPSLITDNQNKAIGRLNSVFGGYKWEIRKTDEGKVYIDLGIEDDRLPADQLAEKKKIEAVLQEAADATEDYWKSKEA